MSGVNRPADRITARLRGINGAMITIESPPMSCAVDAAAFRDAVPRTFSGRLDLYHYRALLVLAEDRYRAWVTYECVYLEMLVRAPAYRGERRPS